MNQSSLTIPTDVDWETDDPIDLRHYWNIINRRKWAIVGLALAVGLLTMLIVFAMTPIYRASATLLIESQEAKVVSIEEVYGLDTNNKDYFATQYEILGARPIAEDVVDGLKLIEQPEFKPDNKRSWLPFAIFERASPSQPQLRERVVATYLEKLTIEPVRNTQLVRVQFDSPDPKLAASVANAHAKAYIANMLDVRADATKSATEWMGKRLDVLRQELLASEARLQAYREQEELVDVAGLRALPSQEITDLSSRLLEARQTREVAEIAYLQVRPAAGHVENLRSIPAILDDEGVRRSQATQATAQQAVAELEKRYGPSHPQMVAAQAELARATENLNEQAQSVAESIKKRYEAARSEEAAIVAALNRARLQYQDVGRKESTLNGLQQAAESNRQVYELFYKRLTETSAAGDLATAQARIVEPAVVPQVPYKPKRGRIVTIAVLLTLLLGVGAAFLLASLDATIKSSADVEEKLKRPLLGIVPLLKDEALRAVSTLSQSAEAKDVDPRFAEAIRTIRTAISLDSLDKPHKIILITSSIGDEGKSIVALNLATAFARTEKTLLLDADMRRPSVRKMLGLPRDAPGLSELLANHARLIECVIRTSVENLDAISTGFIPPDPLELLSSARMAMALKVLANHYSRVIIDCPPILPVSDAALLSKYADAVLFLVKSDATSVPQIRNGLGLLERIDAPITGIVLTQLDTRKAEKYGDYGYAGYYAPYASKS